MNTSITELYDGLREMQNSGKRIILAIDGGSCSGKTTLADKLQTEFGATVIHMDDFYLRPEQRTPERYDEPGGNVDRERFIEEVLIPLRKGVPFTYRPFDCKTMTIKGGVPIFPAALTIIEGSYSLHPELARYYDIKVFLAVSKALQSARVTVREGANARMFTMRWIPLEDRYHYAFHPDRSADYVINVG